jgi:hypothetical protein
MPIRDDSIDAEYTLREDAVKEFKLQIHDSPHKAL